jgi:hypothetical protein
MRTHSIRALARLWLRYRRHIQYFLELVSLSIARRWKTVGNIRIAREQELGSGLPSRAGTPHTVEHPTEGVDLHIPHACLLLSICMANALDSMTELPPFPLWLPFARTEFLSKHLTSYHPQEQPSQADLRD